MKALHMYKAKDFIERVVSHVFSGSVDWTWKRANQKQPMTWEVKIPRQACQR